ncbi:hypothetical protein KP509_11G017300 [Ceratopteris richardii]|uniref:Uncharacterized protein n=1 Tax=Ceratopteris richardii TaxID=49495 RepID=A0A8T2TTA2_CERRI|nr:hypothetical protein KP509_11G017300 [Ceratopteris richardii]
MRTSYFVLLLLLLIHSWWIFLTYPSSLHTLQNGAAEGVLTTSSLLLHLHLYPHECISILYPGGTPFLVYFHFILYFLCIWVPCHVLLPVVFILLSGDLSHI